MVGLGPTCKQLVFAARPVYLSLTYNYMSGCPKYKGTTCLHIPTTQVDVIKFCVRHGELESRWNSEHHSKIFHYDEKNCYELVESAERFWRCKL